MCWPLSPISIGSHLAIHHHVMMHRSFVGELEAGARGAPVSAAAFSDPAPAGLRAMNPGQSVATGEAFAQLRPLLRGEIHLEVLVHRD